MTLEGHLTLEHNNQFFDLHVKTILVKNVYYFFLTGNEKNTSTLPLAGVVIEMVYSNGFFSADKKISGINASIPQDLYDNIEKTLLSNKQLWHY